MEKMHAKVVLGRTWKFRKRPNFEHLFDPTLLQGGMDCFYVDVCFFKAHGLRNTIEDLCPRLGSYITTNHAITTLKSYHPFILKIQY